MANAKIAYRRSSGSSAVRAGRRSPPRARASQRPLWASTSTKNPDYSDTLYVDELIGPDTVNTMPDQTIDATRDHGTAKRTVDVDVDQAVETMKEIEAAGVDVEQIVLHQLVDEGVESFAKSYQDLLDAIETQGVTS